ncbi:PIN-like domain-containing protein [Actinosynnema sp. CS-041913]|uniref:PIN-like domain-containing protein n=1 Tax=Actinosynnema sp. CS-041913 TaxID=3239917 RepID=UPI003D8BF89F
MTDDNEHRQVRDGANIADNFGAYQTASKDDYHRVLASGLVVLDTSCLLSLYLYTPQTRRDFIGTFSAIGPNLWIPHEAMQEFWENREHIVEEATKLSQRTSDSLRSLEIKMLMEMQTWGRRVSLSTDQLDSLENILSRAVEEVQQKILSTGTRNDLSEARDTTRDPVLRELMGALEKNVGPPLSQSELENAIQEGQRRLANKIPPGYMDRNKADRSASGDYIKWEQTLREAELRSRDVLLITADAKEDWWRRSRGRLLGPRPELFEELAERTGKKLFMARPDTFLRLASNLFSLPVTFASVDNVLTVEGSEVNIDRRPETHDIHARAQLIAMAYSEYLSKRGIETKPATQDQYGSFTANINGACYFFKFRSAATVLRVDMLGSISQAAQQEGAEEGVILSDAIPNPITLAILERNGVAAIWRAADKSWSGNAYADQKGLTASS